MITNGKVVTVAYSLHNAEQELLDQADASDPFVYLHGSHQVVPGFESALEGMSVGDKKGFSLPPADAYGEINPELQMTVKRSQFPRNVDLQEGMQFQTELPQGDSVVFTIEAITGDDVQINGNHPLAGETLNFQVEVLDMRDATEEELEHGHAHHGDHDHHH